jgi:hypothetical protein
MAHRVHKVGAGPEAGRFAQVTAGFAVETGLRYFSLHQVSLQVERP